MEEYLNKIICGDCLEILKQLPNKSIDMILQDPPYNTTACEWEWDIMTKIDEFWKEWKRVIKDNGAIVMTASQPFTSKLVMSNLKMFKYEWIWEKTNSTGFLDARRKPLKAHENIVVFAKKNTIYNPQKTDGKPYTQKMGRRGLSQTADSKIQQGGYITISDGKRFPKTVLKIANGEKGLHPTQKPVALFEYLIKTYTNENDIVFDGFAGSGTTAIACINTNRKYICVEINEKYHKIAQERINNLPPKLI